MPYYKDRAVAQANIRRNLRLRASGVSRGDVWQMVRNAPLGMPYVAQRAIPSMHWSNDPSTRAAVNIQRAWRSYKSWRPQR